MSEQAQSTQFETVSLDVDLSKADIEFPLFPAGLVRLKIKGFRVEPNKAQTGRNLVAFFSTEQTLTTTKGFEKGPGFTFKKYYPLQASEKNPDWDWTANLAQLKNAALGHHDGAFNSEELVGKELIGKVTIETGERGEMNSIDKLMSIEDVK